MYDGDLPDSAEELREGMYLIPITDPVAAEHPLAFPPVDGKAVPPDTFYAFDESTSRVEFMYSMDAQNIGIAWDVDRDGRYFARLGYRHGERVKLQCPRFVEYSYDCSNAIVAGEEWHRNHRNYMGSLNHRSGGYPDRSAPSVPAQRKVTSMAQREAARTAVKPPLPKRGAPAEPATRILPTQGGRKPLPRKKDAESGLLNNGRLDKSALDKTASDMVKKYDDHFGAPVKKVAVNKAALPIKRKRR